MDKPITLLCGPPGSGKSTFAKANAGDLPVLDWDDLWSEITGLSPHHRDIPNAEAWIDRTESVFRGKMANMTEGWILRYAAKAQQRAIIRNTKNARSIVLAVPASVCIARIEADPRRQAKGRDIKAALDWWQDYEPSSSPDETVLRPE